MEYLVTQTEMQQYDKNTIECLKMPSIVLMERAALVTVEQIQKEMGDMPYRVLVVAGNGNNGGDGFAIGRLLMLKGCQVDFVLIGNKDKCSRETALQLEILTGYGCILYDRIPEAEYDIVIDAIFGIGLSRMVEGIYKDTIEKINEQHSYICSVDIPSGVHADSGKILGCAVQADLTVTYGFRKLGEYLYPGAECCGKIICGQMGIDEYSFLEKKPHWYTYTSLRDVRLPVRKPNGNKGTFGKVLVIAGSDTVCGAAILAGRSVFRMGVGMVKIITSWKNRDAILQTMPEAMLNVYDTTLWQEMEPYTEFAQSFRKDLEWADCILIGPGIGTEKEAAWMLTCCLRESSLPIVIDADGLNLLAEREREADSEEISSMNKRMILTPHLKEFARLYGCSTEEVLENITVYPQKLANKFNCVVVCKDARTVIAHAEGEQCYLNTSGNAGMATAGSGDVLAGVIAGLLAQGMPPKEAAVTGTYLHGVAGDMASRAHGEHGMMAADMIEQMQELLKICESCEDRQC